MPYLASAQNVSNLAELESRLSSSDGGETILLEPGHYGDLDIINKDYGSFVTIQSANTAKPAVFNSVTIQGTSYLRLDNVLLSNSSNGEAASSILSISGGSEFIEFINSEAHGLIDDDYSGHRIIDVEESSEVFDYGVSGIFAPTFVSQAVCFSSISAARSELFLIRFFCSIGSSLRLNRASGCTP